MAVFNQTEETVWHHVFTSIIEDADSNILLLDERFTVLTLNPAFYWIFLETYGVELKKGTSLLKALRKLNPALREMWQARCVNALKGNVAKVEESFTIDGADYHWEIYFKGSELSDGSRVISVFSRDITVRKAFQRRLIENEANVRSILNTLEDSLWLINSKFELIDFNREFFKRYHQAYGVRLTHGANIIALIPETHAQLRKVWEERYTTGLRGRLGKYIDTYEIDGVHYTYEVKTYPILKEGIVTGLTVYAQDISSQIRSEKLLKAQNEELTKINTELDRFVYSASHDLRAPLMSIKGLVNVMKVDPEKENFNHYLAMIEKSINRLDTFILDIIDYSRNSRMDFIAKPIDFDALINESMDSLRFAEGAVAVRFEKHFSIACPLFSDYSRILIIFNNMISNAVRYRDVQKDDSFLSIAVSVNEQEATLIFKDNGVGILPEHIDNVFKMFYRANADSNGSGLGLYIVKGVVEKLHGTIEVQSAHGEGTTFTVTLPNTPSK